MYREKEVKDLQFKVQSLEQQIANFKLSAGPSPHQSQPAKTKRSHRGWAKKPEKGSLLDPLRQQDLDVDALYREGSKVLK